MSQFEKDCKKHVHSEINFRQNKIGAPDVSGVYLGNYSLGLVVPVDEIYMKRNLNHVDANNVVFRSAPEAMEIIKAKCIKFRKNLAAGIE